MAASEKLIFTVKNDVTRTDPGNDVFKRDCCNGSNPLFNVLMAYASFDPEVNYC
jgi:hypothetical protein